MTPDELWEKYSEWTPHRVSGAMFRDDFLAALKEYGEAENAELRKDAERYRYLRDNHRSDIKHRLVWYFPRITPLNSEGLDSNLDEAIDRARSANDT